MRALAAVLLLVLAGPGRVCAWPFDLMPADRIEGAMLTLDYERPWAGLDLSRGRASGGVPLPGGVWCGGRVMALGAPTVAETGFGGWVVVRRWMLFALDQVETRVEGLPPDRRTDAEMALQIHSGPLSVGWAARAEGVHSSGPAVWRHWWVGLVAAGAEIVVGRRVTPWVAEPGWALGVRMGLGGGVEAGLGWQHGEATLALGYTTSFAHFTAATGWTGPRSGGFGFRLRAGGR